jgi:hypothetical protein
VGRGLSQLVLGKLSPKNTKNTKNMKNPTKNTKNVLFVMVGAPKNRKISSDDHFQFPGGRRAVTGGARETFPEKHEKHEKPYKKHEKRL